MTNRPQIFGQLLIGTTALQEDVLEVAFNEQRTTGRRLGETLVFLGAITPDDVARALAVQLGLEHAPSPLDPSRAALKTVSPELARAHSALPLSLTRKSLQIAMADPLDLAAVEDMRFQTGRRIETAVASVDAVRDAIDLHYGGDLDELVAALPADLKTGPNKPAMSLDEVTRAAPVVRLVDSLIGRAIDDGASDIHVEETGGEVRVRYRVDGVLRQMLDLPAEARRAILSRLKVTAGMDISVKCRAQDGGIDFAHGDRSLSLRVSTLPVNKGERAVVRILDPEAAPRSLHALGFSTPDLAVVTRLLEGGEGVILVAGPTESGKSTTIFAALSQLDRETRNIVTIEDPVEYRLPGANQIQVDPRAGLGFGEALRAILRQDPDVVMIGEIRDRETAEIAMAAAITGHLVLSTIHTTDAPGAVARLINMGVPPFLIAGGLAGVIAQRLVRRPCQLCRGAGCDVCGDGHKGRTGVFQVLALTDPLRDAISREEPSSRLRSLAVEAGMGSLGADARRAVAERLTTPHEIKRLIQSEGGAATPCASCGVGVPMGALACPGCGRQRARVCTCGRILERAWRYCPWCVRPSSAA